VGVCGCGGVCVCVCVSVSMAIESVTTSAMARLSH
jgi:hypothetical protein